jgi:hypothetical protein
VDLSNPQFEPPRKKQKLGVDGSGKKNKISHMYDKTRKL